MVHLIPDYWDLQAVYKKTGIIMTKNVNFMVISMFHEKIKSLRQSRNLNQAEAASAIGISKNTYLKYEKDEQSPLLSTVQKIASYYGINTAELVSDEPIDNENQFSAKLKLLDQLNDKEKESVMMILEALVIKSKTEQIKRNFN